MYKFIKNTIYFILFIIALSYPLSIFITSNFNSYSKQNWVLKIKNYNLDYAVLGSSRVYNMIDINSLDSTFKKKGINLGTSGSAYAENYIILSEFISKNKISTLILNTDEYCFNSKNSYGSDPLHKYEFLPLFNKYNDVFYDYIPKWKFYLWKIIPVTKYIEYNKQFNLDSRPLFDKNMGSNLMAVNTKNKKLIFKRHQTIISDLDKKYFLKIIDLCEVNNIKLILITTPIYNKNNKNDNSISKQYIKSISGKLNLNYYEFYDLIKNNPDYFNDNTHTNKFGTIEYSINLGKKLRTNNE